MKILVCSWGNICEPDLELSLADMGHEVKVLKEKIENRDYDLDYLKKLSDMLLEMNYDCVFSINFIPIISRVCNAHHIKYISWTVDSPWFQLNSNTTNNRCNYIFIFDRNLYNHFIDKSEQIYYMPLGANVKFWDSILLSEEDNKRFTTDVSFVGSLYEDKHNYDLVEMPDYLKGYLDGIIEAQTNIYGYNFLNEVIADDIIDEFSECANWKGLGQDYNVSKRDIIVTEFVGRKCAEIERHRVVNILAKEFKFNLYTLSNTDSMPHVNNQGPADSRMDMPKIFKSSKINLNMTIKTIESGIPLRIYDIMGNGGFVITNYQSELLEYFVPDEDLVIYENLEDLQCKISYYLQHDEERKIIAENGYKKVKALHTVEKRLKDMIEIAWQDKTKCYGINNEKTNEKYLELLELLSQIQVSKLLDVGMFLQRFENMPFSDGTNLKNKYHIDGVRMIYSISGREEEALYKNVYQLNQLPSSYYDMVVMVDLLKFLSEEEILYMVKQCKQISQVILIDYEEAYLELLKQYDIQRLQVGQCELLLITIN